MNYYKEIKEEFINNKVYRRVKDYSKNKSDLNTYYTVGELLYKAGKHYGEGIIENYSKRLTLELEKGYTTTNLKYMRKFYIFIEKSHAMRDQLTWTHYRELLRLTNKNEINYYVDITIRQNLFYRKLRDKIKDKEYERLSEETKNKLINEREEKIDDFIKNPILIRNVKSYKKITEKILKQVILEDISSFMKELGEGFCYIDSEYRIKIGDRYNYIDLLLFNIKYNCYVAVELKVVELKKEHIGQILTYVHYYVHYIDKNIKSIAHERTIRIIIVKKDNKFIMEYCSDKRIYRTTYSLVK